MTKEETIAYAIRAIVTYETLPPQIDYRVPYEIKMQIAKAFLLTLTVEELDNIYAEIEKQVTKYYEPVEMADGNYYSPAEMDAMF